MTADEAARGCAAEYYEMRTGKTLTGGQREAITRMLESGLTAGRVMDAVDAAICRWGLAGTAGDYWQTVLDECREAYRKLRRAGVI